MFDFSASVSVFTARLVSSAADIDGVLIPLLRDADTIIGHNVVQFDLAVLKRPYGLNVDIDKVYDALVMARLVFPPKSSKERYSLGSVAQRFGIDGTMTARQC